MGTRTVRLDEEAERALAEVREATGLPISEALKRGLRSLQAEVRQAVVRTPYDVFRDLQPGAAGASIGPSTVVKRKVRQAIRRKLGR